MSVLVRCPYFRGFLREGFHTFTTSYPSRPTAVVVLTPPEIIEPPETTFVDIQTGVTLTCIAVGNPQPDVQWWRNNQMLTREVLGKLIIAETSLDDRGVYFCIASNTEGEVQSRNAVINLRSK